MPIALCGCRIAASLSASFTGQDGSGSPSAGSNTSKEKEMPDIRDNRNIIDKSFEVFDKVQRGMGSPPPDEVSFVGGFMTCFGIMVGRIDIGLDQNAPLTTIMEAIHKDIAAFGMRIAENQRKQDALNDTIRTAAQNAAKRNGS